MPWYTTADARRDAEKQAARNKITDLGIGMSYTFEIGKSGAVKAIHELGAIEIVPHWTWHAMAFRQLIEERDQLRAQLAEYAEAPTVENEMTNNYATIRTALESARDYITTDLASERGAFEGHECVSRIDEIKVDLAENALALADLAELEKATRVPVGNVIQEQDGSTGVIWADVPAFGSKLYAAPPVPAVGVTDEVARKVFNAWIDARWRMNEGQDVKYGHAMIGVVQAELGPTLGLVAWREPTDDECREIFRAYKEHEGDGSKVWNGRAMFNAVREVMGGGK